ncbi:hypothetical protein NQZ68_023750 [Dissostichus eleginoides]|nr:hypothetical protein NQZ68_023750 [Dissostichus eleginoides]
MKRLRRSKLSFGATSEEEQKVNNEGEIEQRERVEDRESNEQEEDRETKEDGREVSMLLKSEGVRSLARGPPAEGTSSVPVLAGSDERRGERLAGENGEDPPINNGPTHQVSIRSPSGSVAFGRAEQKAPPSVTHTHCHLPLLARQVGCSSVLSTMIQFLPPIGEYEGKKRTLFFTSIVLKYHRDGVEPGDDEMSDLGGDMARPGAVLPERLKLSEANGASVGGGVLHYDD